MLGELGIIATLLQWLHAIRADRSAAEQKADLDSYLEWLRRHNHQDLLSAILESRDATTKLEEFIRQNHEELLGIGDRILDAVTDSHGELKEKLKDIQTSLDNLPTKTELKEMLDELSQKIKHDYVQNHQAVPSRDILKYKALGNRLADYKALLNVPNVLDEHGHISLDRIKHLHKKIFPAGFAWAGTLRDQPVFIAGFFGTAARVVDLVQSRFEISLASPDQISEAMKQLCDSWNSEVEEIRKHDLHSKAMYLAQFHYEFEVIHPFLDGNGRVGRLILDQQTSWLLSKPLHLQFDREEYYKALRFGNMGSIDQLRDLVIKAINNAIRSADAE